jgi:heme exporter protein D
LGEGGFGPGIERTGGKENEKECEDGPSETWFGSGGGHRSWGWNIFCLLQVIVRAVRQRASFLRNKTQKNRRSKSISINTQLEAAKRRESVFCLPQIEKLKTHTDSYPLSR